MGEAVDLVAALLIAVALHRGIGQRPTAPRTLAVAWLVGAVAVTALPYVIHLVPVPVAFAGGLLAIGFGFLATGWVLAWCVAADPRR